MAVLFTALACFAGGAVAGWVLMSARSVWAMDRIVVRQQREITRLRERVAHAEQVARTLQRDAGGRR